MLAAEGDPLARSRGPIASEDDWLKPQWASYQSLIGQNTVVFSSEIAGGSAHLCSFLSGTVVQLGTDV